MGENCSFMGHMNLIFTSLDRKGRMGEWWCVADLLERRGIMNFIIKVSKMEDVVAEIKK